THARAVRVEDANDVRVDAVLAMVRHGHRLGKAFGLIVDAADADRVDIAPVVFLLRMTFGIAVDFAGGSQEEASVLRLGDAERDMGAERADLERGDGMAQVIDGTRWRGEME